MANYIQQWVLAGVIATPLAGGPSAPALRSQNPAKQSEPRPGSRADQAEDKQEAHELRSAIRQDEERLRTDRRRFGDGSPEVIADRAKLRHDRQALRRLRADRRADRRIRRRRRLRDNP